MLIRSQDKKTLVNLESINAIRIYEENTGFSVNALGVGVNYEIGEYSTEEKAIKVLDMIQHVYTQYGTLRDRGGSVQGAFNLPKVFQMPQDSEV